MKKGLILLLLLITNVSFSQKETNIWYFGNNAGLDFNSGSPVVLLDGALITDEGCATISDASGNLLFYTDGKTVYNRAHAIMQNGMGLNGHASSTHSALIIPKPNNPDIYYIFTVDYQARSNGLQYSEVDISLDGGLGGITTTKNILLETPTTENLTAVKNTLTNDYWLVSHKWNSNEFITYLVSDTGVNNTPVISASGTVVGGIDDSVASGQIKISPNGKKLAVARNEGLSEAQLFDFDASTGIVSNPITLMDRPDIDQVYGVEFSPNSKVLYISSPGNGIYQYNLEAGSPTGIIASQFLITSLPRPFAGMQLATNGKIYVAIPSKLRIDVIDNPNALGAACNFQFESLYLGGRMSQYGLPPFIQSFLQIDDIQFENVCFRDTTTFELSDTVDSASWNFGDPASGGNNASTDLQPTHVFSAPGTYEVSVTATVGTETATETTSVTIFEQPVVVNPPDYMLCDYDGGRTFYFDSYSSYVLGTLDPDIFGVYYYEGMDNYNNGIKIPIPNAYVGPTNFFVQEIIAEVYNKQNPACSTITSFNAGIDRIPKLKPKEELPTLVLCDDIASGSDTDGRSVFNLTQYEGNLLAEPMANVDYFYYLDETLQQIILSPETYTNTQNPLVIFVEGVNRDTGYCRDVSSFIIEVQSLPQINSPVSLKQCDDDLDGFSAFNLNEVIPKIISNPANETIAFFASQSDAENNNNPITNPTAYINPTVSSDTVWARVENTNGCFRISEVELIVTTTQIPSTFTRDFYVCDDNSDGISTFDFSLVNQEIEAMFPVGQQLVIAYYRNETDALAEVNAITDITNYTNTGYPNSQQIYVRVDSELDNDCLGLGAHINLFVEAKPIANLVSIQRQCDDDHDGLFAFDVSQIETEVLNGQSLADVTVSYFDGNNNPLPSPLPNPFLTNSQTITIRVSNNNVTDGSCYGETTLAFIVDRQPIANPIADQIACDGGIDDADGIHPFDTSLIENTILNGQSGMEVHYFAENGTELPSPLPNPFLTSSQTITVRVVNPLNNICSATTVFDFIVNPLPEFSIDTPQIVCSSDPTFTVVLNPMEANSSEIYSYEWVYENGTVLSNDPTLTVSTPGTYSVTLTKTDGTGCSRTREIFVNASELATLTQDDITIVDNSSSNSITISTSNLGQGDYEFALDDTSLYQDSPYFNNVKSGIHTLYVRDKKGCGTSSIEVSVIGYPKYFTPNSDGVNDYWHIKGVNGQFQTLSDIFIYDRYGKLLRQLATTSNGWDGTFNGSMMPTDDYWFSVLLEDGREFKGHFALKR
jgi:gliding motility-associated-like protein